MWFCFRFSLDSESSLSKCPALACRRLRTSSTILIASFFGREGGCDLVVCNFYESNHRHVLVLSNHCGGCVSPQRDVDLITNAPVEPRISSTVILAVPPRFSLHFLGGGSPWSIFPPFPTRSRRGGGSPTNDSLATADRAAARVNAPGRPALNGPCLPCNVEHECSVQCTSPHLHGRGGHSGSFLRCTATAKMPLKKQPD